MRLFNGVKKQFKSILISMRAILIKELGYLSRFKINPIVSTQLLRNKNVSKLSTC